MKTWLPLAFAAEMRWKLPLFLFKKQLDKAAFCPYHPGDSLRERAGEKGGVL